MSRGFLREGLLASSHGLAVLVGVAALAVLSARHAWRVDVTEERRHELSAGSAAVVAQIPPDAEPVDLVIVTSLGAGQGDAKRAVQAFEPLLARYANASNRIRGRIAIAEREPHLVDRLRIRRLPAAVVHWNAPATPGRGAEERERRTDAVTEEGIAAALRELLEGEREVAAVLFGHGELRSTDTGPEGFAFARQLLESLNFDVRDLALAGSGDVPADVDLLVVPGPQADFVPAELEAIGRFVARGGSLIVLLGPGTEPGAQPELRRFLLETADVKVEDGVVADFDMPLGSNQVVLIIPPSETATHPIVAGLATMVQLPLARSIGPGGTRPVGVSVEAFLMSGPRSWRETDLATVPPAFDDRVDPPGPLPLAVAATRRTADRETRARLVAIGCRHVFANQFITSGGNAELLRNAVAWVTGQEKDLLAKKEPGRDGTVIVPRTQGLVVLAMVLFVPVVVGTAGIATWWMRRRL